MTRPLYETQNDRAREMDAIRKIAGPNDIVRKLPIRYGVDFLVFRNDVAHAWIEVKCRNNPKDQYPDLMISVAKILEGIKTSQMTGLPFVLVIEWTDVVGTLRIHNTDGFKMGWGGRDDRGDAQDQEPVFHIPTAHFAIRFKKR